MGRESGKMLVGGRVGSSATNVSDGASHGKPRQRVLLVVGDGQVKSYPLRERTTLTVGRDATCDVQLEHPKISRRHAVLHVDATVAIEDLGSRNGTRLAGAPAPSHARLPLSLGAPIELGPFVAIVLDAPPHASEDRPGSANLVVADPTVAGATEIVSRIAQGGISVLILGETGAGKDVLARTLHQLSRRGGQFVAVNCAALTEAMLESELFGHERGAFTGAASAKPGLFEIARGGTVFLDEIGELSPELQAKLLRVLETREVYRLGATAPTQLDIRFLSATHRDLARAVASGSFRGDFWFRINGITLAVPPLRRRRDAIRPLAERFLADAARAAGRTPPHLGRAALAVLASHDWPGNVRELRTVIERAVMFATGDELAGADILIDRAASVPDDDTGKDGRARLVASAAAHRGNVTKIAQALGTSRSQVRRLARRHRLDLARYR